MASAIKTRHSSGSAMADYLGPGRTLLLSELPTLRAALKQGLLFKEERILKEDTMRQGRSYSYPLTELVTDMTQAVITQYHRANQGFQPPVIISERAVCLKLKLAWETAQKIAKKHITKSSQIQAFESKLDRLLDILKCKCPIKLCQEFGCPEQCRRCRNCGQCGECKLCKDCTECEQGAHIACSCSKEEKIPVLELRFILAQREKKGEKGAMMIATTVDMKEQKKRNAQEARQEVEKRRKECRDEKAEKE